MHIDCRVVMHKRNSSVQKHSSTNQGPVNQIGLWQARVDGYQAEGRTSRSLKLRVRKRLVWSSIAETEAPIVSICKKLEIDFDILSSSHG